MVLLTIEIRLHFSFPVVRSNCALDVAFWFKTIRTPSLGMMRMMMMMMMMMMTIMMMMMMMHRLRPMPHGSVQTASTACSWLFVVLYDRIYRSIF